jgi:hypothetical protein
MKRIGQSLDRIVSRLPDLKPVLMKDLDPGDRLEIHTRNSVYVVEILGDGLCHVSGGWFDRKGLAPFLTSITGCSWGSSIILMEIAAACGLCMEFGNRVVTSPVQRILVIKPTRVGLN